MICPLCEHVQEHGAACDVCGRALSGAGLMVEKVERLEGLEPTRLDPPPGSAPGQALPDLEPTGLGGTDRDRAGPSSPTTCPHCEAPADPAERYCARCGLRLPFYRPATPPEEPEPVRCRACGASVQGSACPECGARIGSED